MKKLLSIVVLVALSVPVLAQSSMSSSSNPTPASDTTMGSDTIPSETPSTIGAESLSHPSSDAQMQEDISSIGTGSGSGSSSMNPSADSASDIDDEVEAEE